jgi:hypothetical protein
MRRSTWILARAAATILAAACGQKGTPAPPSPVPAGPTLIVYYMDAAGVHRLDTQSGADSLYFRVPRRAVTSAVSPDHSRLALGLAGPVGARLVVVDIASGRVTGVHAAGKGYRYTLAWSPGADRLAFGYVAGSGRGRGGASLRGEVMAVAPGGQTERVGCDASKLVFAWTSRDTIVVGDGRNLFPVDVHGCRGNGVIYGAGKRQITFSPDGKRLFYYGTGRVRRGRASANELYVANSDGLGDHRIVGAAYDPRHAQWSPDGSRLVLDVQSPDTASLRYVAVYDVVQQHLRFFPSHTAHGVPRDTDPVWAPNGNDIVHQRALDEEHELILRPLAQDPTAVHVEPTVLLTEPPTGAVWGWVDDSHLIVVSDHWTKVLTTDGVVLYTMAGGRTPLAVVNHR